MEIIVRETGRLERILNDQLAFVRSAKLQLAPTALNPLVRESLALLRQQLELRHIAVEVELGRELATARLDADRIKQVLVNLLMNAMEAADAGGRIRVATRAAPAAVQLEVANTGPPIPPEVVATMFAPFTTTKQEGTGLGMAVVQQILAEHGGSIAVRTEPPWGSVFTIRLPLEPPEAA
jgi:two-component system sensor histidine kinase HydH